MKLREEKDGGGVPSCWHFLVYWKCYNLFDNNLFFILVLSLRNKTGGINNSFGLLVSKLWLLLELFEPSG